MTVVWRDGKLVEPDACVVPMLCGWGAFSTVGCDLGRPLLWTLHHRRLSASLSHLGCGDGVVLPEVDDLCGLLAESGLSGAARIRVVVRRVKNSRWSVEASASSHDRCGPNMEPVRLTVEKWRAPPPLVGHKTLSRLAWDLAREQAVAHGHDDALLVDGAGHLLETSLANVWTVNGSLVRTPPAPARCLPGVMRSWLHQNLGRVDLDVREDDLKISDLSAVDEVWISNTVLGVRRVGSIDDLLFSAWPQKSI